MEKTKITVGGWEFTVVPTDLFCPKCGQDKVFVETGDGDYYVGPNHFCFDCDFIFHLQ